MPLEGRPAQGVLFAVYSFSDGLTEHGTEMAALNVKRKGLFVRPY